MPNYFLNRLLPEKKDEATQKTPEAGKAKGTHLGFVGPNDRVYSGGLLISGRKVVLPEPEQTPKKKEE